MKDGSAEPLANVRFDSKLKNPFFSFAVKAVGIWLIILVCAVLNGAFREIYLIPKLGIFPAQVLSGVLLSVIILLFSCGLIPRLGVLNKAQGFYLGVFWLCLTLLFEFGFGLVQGKSWPVMLEAYTFKDGNIWPLVLLVVLLSPLLVIIVRGKKETNPGIP